METEHGKRIVELLIKCRGKFNDDDLIALNREIVVQMKNRVKEIERG